MGSLSHDVVAQSVSSENDVAFLRPMKITL